MKLAAVVDVGDQYIYILYIYIYQNYGFYSLFKKDTNSHSVFDWIGWIFMDFSWL